MPRIVDHAAQRDHVAQVAFALLAGEGYGSTSMRKIATRAGVSAPGLYHYFPDKAAIVAHAFAMMIREDESRVRAALPADATLELRARVVLSFVRHHRAHLGDLLRVALEVHRYEPQVRSREDVRLAMERYRGVLAEVLAVDDPDMVQAAFAWLIGTLIKEMLDPGGLLDEDREESALRLWQSLLTRPAT